MIPYRPPGFHAKAFNCPHCNAYSNQIWYRMWYNYSGSWHDLKNLEKAFCCHCNNYSLWHFEKMIYPEDSGVQPPNSDLNNDIQDDYLEAKAIVNQSPRGAAAILRLCIQKLCRQLGEKGKNINDDIAELVKKGLPLKIQKALDTVRVIGNNAVHPGEIDIKDDKDIAIKLFELINLIAEVMITQKKQIETLYESLPKSQREAIQKRNNKESTSTE